LIQFVLAILVGAVLIAITVPRMARA